MSTFVSSFGSTVRSLARNARLTHSLARSPLLPIHWAALELELLMSHFHIDVDDMVVGDEVEVHHLDSHKFNLIRYFLQT